MTTAPTIKIELANDAPAPQDRGRKVSERIREALDKVSVHIPANVYRSKRAESKKEKEISEEDSKYPTVRNSSAKENHCSNFVGNLTTAQNFLHLLCVLLIIAMLGMIAIGVAAWQMNAVLERKSEVSRNQAMAKLLNEKLISAQEILMTSKKELSNLRQKNDEIDECFNQVLWNLTRTLLITRSELHETLEFSKLWSDIEVTWIYPLNGYKYRYTDAKGKWQTTRRLCQNEGGDLVGKRFFEPRLKKLLKEKENIFNKQTDVFIGLQKRNSGMWFWIDNPTVPVPKHEIDTKLSGNPSDGMCAKLGLSNNDYIVSYESCDNSQLSGLCEAKVQYF